MGETHTAKMESIACDRQGFGFSKGTVRTLQRKLLQWYDVNKRDLPWRKNVSPYRVWVSEIMLQQTQVATVIPYFKRFVKSFPSIRALANADEQEVLRHWEGLGYYRRARQLHTAAKLIVEKLGGRFPRTFDEVIQLPGIGRYTAGAILSISMGQALPILEGNTIRLFSRLLALGVDVKSSEGQSLFWSFSESILPAQRVADFNQALMELGAMVCTAKSPACGVCPLRGQCRAYSDGNVEVYPVSRPGEQMQKVRDAAIVIRRQDRLLLRQCLPGEVWAGLWDFPRFRLPEPLSDGKNRWLEKQVHLETGLSVRLGEPAVSIKHAVTRYQIVLDCHLADSVSGRMKSRDQTHRWIPSAAVGQLPLSVTGRKIANRLCSE
jgi:A/G-specific adenine glycosylase